MNPIEITLSFLSAINQHDVEKMLSLMTPTHAFVDSLGNRITGKPQMHRAWTGYFAICPDYAISHEAIAQSGVTVLASGQAGGTIRGQTWSVPAAFKAVVVDGLVDHWQVYADNKPVYEILARVK
jgi:ketosteroid isomerase-like protein